MDAKLAEQILEELVPTLEALDTQSTATTQFLKDKKIASDEEFAPYLQQAASASSVRWRALGLRMKRLFSLAEKEAEKKSESAASEEKKSAKAKAEKPKADQTNASKGSKRRDDGTGATGSPARSNQNPELRKEATDDGKQDSSTERNRPDAA
jgi:hypothetical protein